MNVEDMKELVNSKLKLLRKLGYSAERMNILRRQLTSGDI